MANETHTDPDHTYGVRGRVVLTPDCASGDAGSNPVAHPMNLRSYQREAIDRLHESFALPASLMRGSGPTPPCAVVDQALRRNRPAVAQLVERRAEDPSVPGSIPGRGTVIADERHHMPASKRSKL